MKTALLTIGTEILIGQITDSNSAFIAQKLYEMGIEVDEIRSISDESSIMLHHFNELKDFDLIITTGGLGPTKDDITKQTLSEFFSLPLVFHEETWQHIQQLFEQKLNRKPNELNKNQALIPEGTVPLPNPLGTAPGMWTSFESAIWINLPGVPFEMKALLENQVIPRLKKKFPTDYIITRKLLVINLPESELALQIEDWENALPGNIKLAYLPAGGRIRLRLTAKGPNQKELAESIENQCRALQKIIPSHLFSTLSDAVEQIIQDWMIQRQKTLAVAESFTAGSLAQAITSIPGSSAYFKAGIVAYSGAMKHQLLGVPQSLIDEHTVVSEEVAIAMAKGIIQKTNSNFAIATTGVAGPSKGEDGKEIGTAWIAITSKENVVAKSFYYPFLHREDFTNILTKRALDMLLGFIIRWDDVN